MPPTPPELAKPGGATGPPVPGAFRAEGPLREALTRLWDQAKGAGVAKIHWVSLRIFDAQDAFRLLSVVGRVQGAEKLVYLTDIEGLRRDVDDPSSLIRQASAEEIDRLIADGTIAGGMIPKVESSTHAVRNGVRAAHILDGRIAHVLLLEIFTDQGIGTMLSRGSAP